jgi:hypothetical protein
MASFRKAQRDIDPRPELYTYYDKSEFPGSFRAKATLSRAG